VTISSSTPYANLDPSMILDAVDSTGLNCTGSLFALNSYENRVYQIGVENSPPVIIKFYRPNRWTDDAILEEHAFSLELKHLEIPIVAPLEFFETKQTLHHFNEFRFAAFPRESGRALELDNLDNLEWMGRFIGRLHAVGACHTFKHRLELNAQTYGAIPYQFLVTNQFLPAHQLADYAALVDSLLQKINAIWQAVNPIKTIRLHGDCHIGNILWNETGPQIVDLDDCLSGPAIQDMWMLMSGDNEEQNRDKLNRVLDGYEEFYEFNYREIYLIEPLRTLRMLHYAGWLARRWEDPAFPLSFPWFNTAAYWSELLDDLREQDMLLEQVLQRVKS
jgi:Ser/Thr protein kinase RdoA (MazF antagonist)